MKNRLGISKLLSTGLLYGVCVVLVCFFAFKPVLQLLSQIDGDEIELLEEVPSEDDTEDDTEDKKETEDEWSENHFHLISLFNADAKFIQVCDLQRTYFDSQHIEIPIQPPRLNTLL